MRSIRSRPSGRWHGRAVAGAMATVLCGCLALGIPGALSTPTTVAGLPGPPGRDSGTAPETTRASAPTSTAFHLRTDAAALLDATAKGSLNQVATTATLVMNDLLRLALDTLGLPRGVALPTAPVSHRQPYPAT